MSTTGYEHQAVDHDASIRAERPDPDQVQITITHGEDEPTSITMWAEDFETMAREVLGGETEAWPFKPGDVVFDSGEDADHTGWLEAAPERTVVSDCDGDEWTRKNDGLWWMNRGRTARAASNDLHTTVGPLTVVSVPEATR